MCICSIHIRLHDSLIICALFRYCNYHFLMNMNYLFLPYFSFWQLQIWLPSRRASLDLLF